MVPLAASDATQRFADIDVEAWHWLALLAVLTVLLTSDLLAHRGNKEPTARRALVESAIWVSFGLTFAGVVLLSWGGTAFSEYLSGYVIEKSLSVDNVFVWSIIFSTFAIPLRYQHRVLFWGVFGALVLRAAFIVGGTTLIDRFWWLLIVFGVILVLSGIKVIRHRDDEGVRGHDSATKLLGRFVPVQKDLAGHHFLVRKAGKWIATPLLAALVVVEVTDVIFAVDSVPAILAVSREPFLVFASNAFAILGLRAMYFLLGDAKQRFHYLSHALGAILIFVGIKMTASRWYHLPTVISLAAIIAIVVAAIVLSVRRTKKVGLAAVPGSRSS
ncbi:MAG: TerC/Alx family metal homeostasis membrane protein [Acidimicrobiia bacterium]